MSVKMGEFCTIQKGVEIGEDTRICNYVQLYGCRIGERCMIAPFTEIQSQVVIGDDTRIQSHSFIASHTEIGKRVFLSHNTCTINDEFKNHIVNYDSSAWGRLIIEDDVIVGSGCVLFPVTIKKGAIIGAGSVVTRDVGENEVWYGNPAKFVKMKK